MEIELNYVKNEGDVQKFAENYYDLSPNIKKGQIWTLLSVLVVSLIVAFPLHKIFEGGVLSYLLLVLILLISCPIPALREHKKDAIKNINKTLTSKYTGVLGEYNAILDEDEIHVTYLPNDTKRERNMTTKWVEFDFYNRDEDHFFIYINKSRLTYHLIAGEQSEKLDKFLKDRGLVQKNKKY
ncbi:hypothetical protein J2Z83_001995 [Virgibacillus natechei]|uniref:YcxB-like protein domain-containing protein n=1 Tax=Virgibacillus natechei TaxID=1216297 RepID=A0ABS4IG27_9BACI|nr:hypothetical protein [Virgibacillus natechei]MBP1969887.1 hypothetical protein [Virgibacillus natechei]UZD12586.1 hypothetical protein OLD84_17060 [Virgibacillus natechei]